MAEETEEKQVILECTSKFFVGTEDAYYADGSVGGWWLIKIFGDVGNELAVRYDGDLALLVAIEKAEFTAPIYVGDMIEVTARLTKVGNTSRRHEFVAKKIIAGYRDPEHITQGDVLDPPEVVGTMVAIDVCPKDKQRIKH